MFLGTLGINVLSNIIFHIGIIEMVGLNNSNVVFFLISELLSKVSKFQMTISGSIFEH